MDDLKTLLAIEKIKRLKARYFRLMDLRHWDEWAELFTKDCVFTFVTPPAWGANNNETKLHLDEVDDPHPGDGNATVQNKYLNEMKGVIEAAEKVA